MVNILRLSIHFCPPLAPSTPTIFFGSIHNYLNLIGLNDKELKNE